MIKAIETWYGGCKFRSRLEARWAVFFDCLGMTWRYEVDGYETSAGRYLPDFYLPDGDTWVEVKGDCEKLDHERMAAFTEGMSPNRMGDGPMAAFLILGDIPRPERIGEVLVVQSLAHADGRARYVRDRSMALAELEIPILPGIYHSEAWLVPADPPPTTGASWLDCDCSLDPANGYECACNFDRLVDPPSPGYKEPGFVLVPITMCRTERGRCRHDLVTTRKNGSGRPIPVDVHTAAKRARSERFGT